MAYVRFAGIFMRARNKDPSHKVLLSTLIAYLSDYTQKCPWATWALPGWRQPQVWPMSYDWNILEYVAANGRGFSRWNISLAPQAGFCINDMKEFVVHDPLLEIRTCFVNLHHKWKQPIWANAAFFNKGCAMRTFSDAFRPNPTICWYHRNDLSKYMTDWPHWITETSRFCFSHFDEIKQKEQICVYDVYSLESMTLMTT